LYKDANKSLCVEDGFMMYIPPLDRSFRMYVASLAGSGKSVMCGKLIDEYVRNRPGKKIYVYSDINEDKALDKLLEKHNCTRILLNDEIVNDPIIIDDVTASSLLLFNDVDAIPNKKIKGAILYKMKF
jgi:hypothetical protein